MMTRDIHIAQFITQYPYPGQFDAGGEYFCSGGERVAARLAEAFADRDYRVSVVTSAAGRTRERTVQNGVSVYRSPSVARLNTAALAPTLPVDGLGLEFDLVHAHDTTPPGILSGWVYATVHDVPLVITHHGGERYERHGSLLRRLGLDAYTGLLQRPLFESADAVVSPSAGYIDESRVLPTIETDVLTIPNGVDAETYQLDRSPAAVRRELGLDPESFTVLYMGALHPRKGPDVLLDAFAELRSRLDAHDSTLLLAGSGDLAESLDARARELGLGDAVRLPGFVPEAEKPLYMHAADVLVLPSVTPSSEVFPLVLLEAAAAGTPVVASDFPTLRPIVATDDIGRLVPPDDPSALAAVLEDLARSEGLRTGLGVNARRMAREHRWSAVADRYLDLFGSVVG